jgi:hypothetical protein
MITNILKPQILIWLIPVLLLFLFLWFRDFVTDSFGDRKDKKRFRIIILVSRVLIFVLLFIALAKPYGEVRTASPGNPKL